MRAQPNPGPAPRPDSRWLGTKAPLFLRPPDTPKCAGHKKSFFPQFRSLQAPALCHWSSAGPSSGRGWRWGGQGATSSPITTTTTIHSPHWAARTWRQPWARRQDQKPRGLTAPPEPAMAAHTLPPIRTIPIPPGLLQTESQVSLSSEEPHSTAQLTPLTTSHSSPQSLVAGTRSHLLL